MAISLKAFLGLDGSGFELGMKRAESAVHKFGHTLEDVTKEKIAGLFGTAAVEEGIRRFAEYSHHISVVADQMSISTDEAQKLDYQMEQTGGSVEAAAEAFKKLRRAQDELIRGNPDFRNYFARLGINPDDAKNLTAKELYGKVSQFVKNSPDGLSPSQEAAMEKLMGRGSSSLIPSMRKSAVEMPDELLVPQETIEKGHAMSVGSGNLLKRFRNAIGASAIFTQEALFATGAMSSANDPEGRRGEALEYGKNRVGHWKWVQRLLGDRINRNYTTSNGDFQGPPIAPPPLATRGIDVDNFSDGLLSHSSDKMTDIFNAARLLNERGRPQIQKDVREIMEMRNKANDIFTDGSNPIADQEAAQLRFGAYNKVRALINPFPDKLNLNSLQTSGLDSIRNPTLNLTGQTRRLAIVMEQLVQELKKNGINVPGIRQTVEAQYR